MLVFNNILVLAIYQLARYIRNEVIKKDNKGRLENICKTLVEDSKRQFLTTRYNLSLEALKGIGRGTTAISAVLSEIFDGKSYNPMVEAAKKHGVSSKSVERANRIGSPADLANKKKIRYGRPDILHLIYNGGKFLPANDMRPTDSLATIENWLKKYGLVKVDEDDKSNKRELTEDEIIRIDECYDKFISESLLVKKIITDKILDHMGEIE